jgi:hypothetical protein
MWHNSTPNAASLNHPAAVKQDLSMEPHIAGWQQFVGLHNSSNSSSDQHATTRQCCRHYKLVLHANIPSVTTKRANHSCLPQGRARPLHILPIIKYKTVQEPININASTSPAQAAAAEKANHQQYNFARNIKW